MAARKNKNETENIQVDLFGKAVSDTEIVERHKVNLASENPKNTQLEMQIESAIVKHDKNLVLLFGKVGKVESMLGLFTKHSEKYPSESVPNGKRLGNAVARKADWTCGTKTYDDVVSWLSDNDATLKVTHNDKGRLFEIC